MFGIKAKNRDPKIKLDTLRKTGEIPAVFYGAGQKNTPISVSNVEFKKVWHKAGESSALKITTLDGIIDAIIHEVQTDPVTSEPIHVDFLAIDMNKKLKVKVPLEFTGISGAVKSGLGTLVKVMYEVEIEALPKDLPQNLVADISTLETLQSQILVSDIRIPTGVTVITHANDVVASIAEQVEEKEEVVAPVDLSAIEVEKKGKKDLPAGEAGEEGSVSTSIIENKKEN